MLKLAKYAGMATVAVGLAITATGPASAWGTYGYYGYHHYRPFYRHHYYDYGYYRPYRHHYYRHWW
jgi:hypothetical protein